MNFYDFLGGCYDEDDGYIEFDFLFDERGCYGSKGGWVEDADADARRS